MIVKRCDTKKRLPVHISFYYFISTKVGSQSQVTYVRLSNARDYSVPNYISNIDKTSKRILISIAIGKTRIL